VNCLIIGFGEVGRAHFNVLKKSYPKEVFWKDKGDSIFDTDDRVWNVNDSKIDLMLVATQCDPKDINDYVQMVKSYAGKFKPSVIDILTTTPCGTCDLIQEAIPSIPVNRSSIRGMHPNLDKFLLDIPKHIGGPSKSVLQDYYSKAGIPCVVHEKARTVEACHVLNNFIYGVNVMAADESAAYCREWGVDYAEFLEYRRTNNSGFTKAGYTSKVSPILYPSGGQIGGHCVCYAPTTISDKIKGKLAKMLESYGK